MSEERTIHWDGKSGREYKYWIYPIGTKMKAVAGNYVFAKETQPNSFKPIYVGETGDLNTRLDNHHKMPCIIRNGATHICTHTNNAGEDARREEEQDIISRWIPPCND